MKNYVTSYTNPDTDGVISAISYSLYSKLSGNEYQAVIFGSIDNETEFILKRFKVVVPPTVEDIMDSNGITLVDTHHPLQLSAGIPLDKVIEIIDHHPDGEPQSFPNLLHIQNEKVGAACTLIAERMKKEYMLPDKTTASLMLLAIYSNTLNFTAPSTSAKDIEMRDWLETLCNVNMELVSEMFTARSNISNTGTLELLSSNMKTFQWGEIRVGIVQTEMIDSKQLLSREDFSTSLKAIKENHSLDFIFYSGVNIISRTTSIYCTDDKSLNILHDAMGIESITNSFVVDRILLRKTDFIPRLKEYFGG